ERETIRDSLIAPQGNPAVEIAGDNARLTITPQGSISAPDEGNSAVDVTGNNARVVNRGVIAGALNGITSIGDDLSLVNSGRIESDSRAVDLSDGDDITVNNSGSIIGTGNQRNGTLYVDGTADNLRVVNERRGTIDAGTGNLGDGISVQVGATGDSSSEDINIVNNGLVQGRGDGAEVFANGARVTANGSSGLRFFNGSGTPQATLTGSVVNNGTIAAEVNVGFLGGLVLEDGVAFDGSIVNNRRGLISGPRNGLYIGNASHNLEIINSGRIESGSRVVNIDGSGVSLRNSGSIIGTGNQRNGTVYSDATADNFSIVNERRGAIDAGEGNQGAAISLQIGDVDGDVVNAVVSNDGLLQGRGNSDGNLAGDGIRVFSGVADGTVTLETNINNQGRILATDDGIDIQAGLTLAGDIINRGTISAGDDGIFIDGSITGAINNFGTVTGNTNAINASDADNPVQVNNQGTLNGNVLLSDFNDVFDSSQGRVNGIVNGGGGDDRLIGTRRNDILTGEVGNDVLTGDRGNDIFVFAPTDFGADIITDYQAGQDLLDVSAFNFGVSGVNAILDGAQQIGADTLLNFANENTVLLQGVQANALEISNFVV
ncbi:MAG: hypothetical protein QNJ51_28680, partial [Calothrix sp. MO_167.B12]|nr:hypothetical protein [Calothrix sp. MO_167.B12]